MQRQSSEQTIQLAIQKYAQGASNRDSNPMNPGDNRFREYMSSVIQSISHAADDKSNDCPSFQGKSSSELTTSVTKAPGDPTKSESEDEEVTGGDTETPTSSIRQTAGDESFKEISPGSSLELAH